MGAVADVAGQLCRDRGLGRPRRLGGGGFAEVFVAAPPGAGEASEDAVALKVGHLPLESSAVYREQFTNERTALFALRDAEHVVRYLDAGVRDEHPYLITEYCATSLAALVSGGRLPLLQAIHYGLGLANGLLAVHAAGFSHGDVTPQNALVRSDGTTVLADFGLARPVGPGAAPTPGFDPAHAAPETVREGVVDDRSDVYGLGSTLFLLVTGEVPGPDDRRRTLRRAMRTGPDGHASGAAVERLVDTLVGMLDDEPAARPALVTTVDALAAARRDGVFGASRPGRLSGRPARRIGLAIAAVIVLGAVAATAVLTRQAPVDVGDLRCVPDATAIDLRNHHSQQQLAVPDAIAGTGTTYIARRASAAQGCGYRLAVTGGGQQPGCLAVTGGSDVVVAACRDDATQAWLVENHYFGDGVMWRRLHPASAPQQCLQQRAGDSPVSAVGQVVGCGTNWLQQWELHEITDAVAGESGEPPPTQACSPPSRLPLVDAAGAATGAPEVTVRACTTASGDTHRAVLAATAAGPVTSVLLAWRIELHGCSTGNGLTARDYAPPQQFAGGPTFTSSTVGIRAGAPGDTYTANGRVGWAVVTDAAGQRWHAGSMPDPIGTTCAAAPAAVPAAAPPATTTERSGTVTDLQPQDGYDFDFGDQGGPESRHGLDISGQSKGYRFDSLAVDRGGLLKRLPPRAEPYGKADCATAPGEWTTNVPGVPVGNSICVRTDEGNTAILTITKAWTGTGTEERAVGFTYRIWYGG